MPPPAQSRFWRRARVTFRWVRITAWLFLLLAVVAGLWLNRAGLPEALKARLLAELRARGLDLEVGLMRLSFHRGLVAEGVRLKATGPGPAPTLAAGEVALRLDAALLRRGQIGLRGLSIADGRLSVPLVAGTEPPRALIFTNLQAQVDFLAEDRWQLSALSGHWSGVAFQLRGTVAHAPAWFAARPATRPAAARERAAFWSRLAARLEQVRFGPSSSLRGVFSGDASRMPHSFSAEVELAADHLGSPWGEGREVTLTLSVRPQSDARARCDLKLGAREARTRWAQGTALRLRAQAEAPFDAVRLENVRLAVEADNPRSRWGGAKQLHARAESAALAPPCWAENGSVELTLTDAQTGWGRAAEVAVRGSMAPDPAAAAQVQGVWRARLQSPAGAGLSARAVQFTARVVHAATNLWPLSATVDAEAIEPVATWSAGGSGNAAAPPARRVRTGTARATAELTFPPWAALALGDTNVSWLVRLEKVPATISAEFTEIKADPFVLPKGELAAEWRAPVVRLVHGRAVAETGEVNARGWLDVVSRECVVGITSSVDPGLLAPLLEPAARSWWAQARWSVPPRFEADLRLVWSAWTNRAPDWRADVLPTLQLAGRVESGAGTARGIAFDALRASVACTNFTWEVPALEIVRPEGRLVARLTSDARSEVFHLCATSRVDPRVVLPLLEKEAERRALQWFEFTTPPHIEGEAWGHWREASRLGFRGRVALTNFSFRAQPLRSLVATAAYTNRLLDFREVLLEREEGRATAGQVRVDLERAVVGLSNVQSRVEVGAVAHAIGPHIERTLAPYRFRTPPEVLIHGVIGFHKGSGLDDAHLGIRGGEFQWQNFRLSRAAADLHWRGDTFSITNFRGLLHGGQVEGGAFFDCAPARGGEDFQFTVTATNVDLHRLLADLFPQTTNKVEGLLSGRLEITNANTADPRSWFGQGDVSLQNGLIWDLPVFGLFSPILNKVSPGLGNSRARQATATFTITNSVIATDDLEVRATGMRMQFEGTVDFEGNVHGTIEAEMFRDAPGLGWLVSKLLWPVTKIFEYRITGTLGRPQARPLYIPKILLAPLHPLRTIKELFGGDKEEK